MTTDDMIPHLLWAGYFWEAQGYRVGASKLYRDKKSAMLLEKNGKASSRKRMRHINIWYLFLKDIVDSRDVDIGHFPIEDIRGYFFTKPLQGREFRRFRSAILGNLRDN